MKLTIDEHPHLYQDLRRHEIIDGEHFAQRAPSPRHQLIIGNLLMLTRCLPGEAFTYVGVVLSEFDLVLPDFLYIPPERRGGIRDQYVECVPHVIAEVVMEETRRVDEIVKRKAYERCGVDEYWIVDPVIELVKIYRRANGVFVREAEISTETGGTITSPLLPGFSMDIAAVFQA